MEINYSIITDNEGGDCRNTQGQVTGVNNLIDTACGDAENLGPVSGISEYLAGNGSATPTHALEPDSNALDAAGGAFCPATDQRGVARPQGAGCDIGAYELLRSVHAPLVVNSTADDDDYLPGDGLCSTGPDNDICTLRAAVQEANNVPGENVVMFDANLANVIQVAFPSLAVITDDLFISGPGVEQLTIVAEGGAEAPADPIITVAPGVRLMLEQIAITGEKEQQRSPAGAIFNDRGSVLLQDCLIFDTGAEAGGGLFSLLGDTEVRNCEFRGNYAYVGGALINAGGTMTINESLITENYGDEAGGVDNNDAVFWWEYHDICERDEEGDCLEIEGRMVITGSTISSNDSRGGGGVRNHSELLIEESTISDNYSDDRAGGVYNRSGTVQITGSVLEGNEAWYAGGGVYNDRGDVNIAHTALNGNRTFESGGAILNYVGSLDVQDSQLDSNYAFYAGGIFNAGGVINIEGLTISQSWADVASAIENTDSNGFLECFANSLGDCKGHIRIKASTFWGNIALFNSGTIRNYDEMEIENVTFSGNQIRYWQDDPDSAGGAIDNRGNAVMTVTNSTFFNNIASKGGAIRNGGDLTLNNSLLTNNGGGGDCSLEGGVIRGARNLSDGGCDPVGDLGPVTGFDPALADNGGPTLTHAIVEGSNALDTADLTLCPDTDQRGITRPQGDGCDVGAFEREYVPTPDEATQSLIKEVQYLVESGALENGNGLIAKLENTIAALEKGNTNAACGQLGAFINQVEAFMGNGGLSVEEGEALIEGASAIMASIGC